MITTFMSLNLPTPSVTLGPEWASDLNTALELVDSHDHTSGKGKKITPAAININATLSFNAQAAEDVSYLELQDQSATLSNPSKVYAVNGDLYWNNGSGVPVQITDGGSVITTPASVESFDYLSVSTSTTIGSGDNTVFVNVDSTSAAVSITVPEASSVAAGRIYVIKDKAGTSETNSISILASGADEIDGETSIVLSSNYGSIIIIGNGATGYSIF